MLTSIDINREYLNRAAKILNSKSHKDTVNESLKYVIQQYAISAEIEAAKNGRYKDLSDPEIMKNVWK